jgi:hypothetical protein
MLPITCTSRDDVVLTWAGVFTVRGYHSHGATLRRVVAIERNMNGDKQ